VKSFLHFFERIIIFKAFKMLNLSLFLLVAAFLFTRAQVQIDGDEVTLLVVLLFP